MIALFVVLGCREPVADVALVGAPIVEDGVDVPLSRRLQVEVDAESRLTVVVRSEARETEIRFPELATRWDVPVHGMTPDTEHELVLRFTTPDGLSAELATLDVHTEPLPPEFPRIDVLASDRDRSEGGYWLVPIECPEVGYWLALYDATDLSLIWLYDGDVNWGDVRMTAEGTIFGLAVAAVEMDLLGNVLSGYVPPDITQVSGPPIPWALNHEAWLEDDGSFWSLAARSTTVLYPLSYEDPTPTALAPIEDPLVVHVGADGAVLAEWALSERLDPSRIGYGSLGLTRKGFDWAHVNGVIPDPVGGYVVSVRHQDVLVKLDAGGDVAWLLGDPAGYGEAWAHLLLTPEPGLDWPYHQHGPEFDQDGVLWMFDNQSTTTTPYSGEAPEAGLSRLAGFAVDEAARTVRQVGEWYPQDELRSTALGSADALPRTGHFLVDFGMLRDENGVLNEDAGRGNNHARIMEIDLTEPAPVVDVRMWTDPVLAPAGVNVYRVEPVESPYGPRAAMVRVR